MSECLKAKIPARPLRVVVTAHVARHMAWYSKNPASILYFPPNSFDNEVPIPLRANSSSPNVVPNEVCSESID